MTDYHKTVDGIDVRGRIAPNDIPIEVRDKHYVHTQDIASTIWYVNHKLGKCPAVQVLDSQSAEWECDIVHIDNDNLEISVGFPLSGKAICN